ncbi:hypothetical protein [Sphingomonas sp. TREG-RG-20F-R18-01]|uniref:hypothetical protein n=1 Tax=Sphingomonas sp. TREG-RG-20F-R18-01 TaxID=2914982 RepID=UPI001F5AA90A|nr:hypothetical protein [Sphingomonas sp. TREG-RG-20F-R18-01]
MLVLIGWCAVMALYLATYTQFEHNAVPVMVASMDFSPESWDQGYFHAKGTMENTNAEEEGDRMVLGSTDVSCDRGAKTCNVATADVFDRFLNLDVTPYDIDSWDNRFITFHSDASICAISTWTIDRTGKTVSLAVKKKSPIPDYALKSPLHPCNGKIDKNVTLTGGFEAYE